MTKYKRIIEEDTEGNQTVVGLIKQGETVKVVKDLGPAQMAIINQKDELKTHCKNLGGFVNVCYVKNELLFNEFNLKLATITRLIYLATYIDYNDREENVLVKHGKDYKVEYLTKKDIQNILKLPKSPFYLFLKESKEKNILFEVNGKFYLSNKIFAKGKGNLRGNFDTKNFTRIFINTTRVLYQNCPISQHKQLAYVFQLIPYMNYETNTICKNPEEKDKRLLKRLSLKEICELLNIGASNSAKYKFEHNLLSFYIEVNEVKYYLFKRIIIKGVNGRNDFFAVNPCVVWKGSDLNTSREILESLVFND